MLSSADKRCMSQDSFNIMSCKMYDQTVALNCSSPVSTVVERTERDTSWVRQVWRVPDYALIDSMKPQDIRFSAFFARMDSEKAVPIRLDSSRMISVVKEQGRLYVYLGLDKFKEFEESYRSIMSRYSFLIVVVPRTVGVYTTSHGDYSAKASVRVTNYSPFFVSGFVCSISFDRTPYESDCRAFETTIVPSAQSAVATARLPVHLELIARYLSNGFSSYRIERDRITITPTTVRFGAAATEYIRDISMKQSGFTGFAFLTPAYNKSLLDF